MPASSSGAPNACQLQRCLAGRWEVHQRASLCQQGGAGPSLPQGLCCSRACSHCNGQRMRATSHLRIDHQNSQYCAMRAGSESNNSLESKDACSTVDWLLVLFVAFCLFLKVYVHVCLHIRNRIKLLIKLVIFLQRSSWKASFYLMFWFFCYSVNIFASLIVHNMWYGIVLRVQTYNKNKKFY